MINNSDTFYLDNLLYTLPIGEFNNVLITIMLHLRSALAIFMYPAAIALCTQLPTNPLYFLLIIIPLSDIQHSTSSGHVVILHFTWTRILSLDNSSYKSSRYTLPWYFIVSRFCLELFNIVLNYQVTSLTQIYTYSLTLTFQYCITLSRIVTFDAILHFQNSCHWGFHKNID